MQIKKKVPIVFNMLICISLFVLALVTYIYSTNISVKKSKSNMMQLVISEGKALEAVAKVNMYQMQLIASSEQVVEYILADEAKRNENKEKTQSYLRSSLVSNSDYAICLLNRSGDVILSSHKNGVQDTVKNIEAYKQVMLGKSVFENIVESSHNGGKVINITVPVYSKEGKVIGAVCRAMSNRVFGNFREEIKVTQRGYIYIIDEDFNIITHSQKDKEGKKLESITLRKLISEYMQNGETNGSYTYSINNRQRYVTFYCDKDTGWTICIEESIADMQKQAIVGSMFIVVTLIALIVMITIVSRGIVKQIVTPIDILIETMGRVAEGDLSSYCTYDANNEFGELSKHYNKMIRKLEESREALTAIEERYKIALEAIDQVIWEYHIKEKKFVATDNWKKIIGEKIDGDYKTEHIDEMLEQVVDQRYIGDMRKKVTQCLEGKIKDFTHDIWIKKLDKKYCLLCKGHAIVNDEGNVEKLIGILTDITNNKKNEERMRKLTFYDELTGCLNKSTFIEAVDNFIRDSKEGKTGVLLFVDLDDFKKVNDALSHDTGDKVLNYIGKKMLEILPQDALIGRFGGDEFVIFKSLGSGIDEVHEMIYDLFSLFQGKVKMEHTNIHLTCSIGIALYPNDGEDSGMLLKNADTAMYKVKETGKNSYSFYTKAMSQQLDRKLLVEEAVREAVGNGSFYLQYQPVVELEHEKTIGCEALIRLCDQELGFISPGEFIPIAEETDLIIETGDWVLENALTTLKMLHNKGYTDFTMNINVSSVQIREEKFVEKLSHVIQKIGVLPQCVKLEVTETVLMEDVEKSIELFNRVKSLGIKIALDDFGTGYSSLNYLRSIPFDVLKIDKSFVDEITTSKVLSEIVDSIINMAHALDILVVAEGVENEMQLEVLRNKGCDYIQGYYFSKPLYETNLEERLKEEKEKYESRQV